jgi:hypothetical protein
MIIRHMLLHNIRVIETVINTQSCLLNSDEALITWYNPNDKPMLKE